MTLKLLDDSLRVNVYYEESDSDFEDNICICILEDCAEEEKIFKADEINLFLTPEQAAELALLLTNAAAESRLAARSLPK
jgi:hypothetical protein